MNYLVIATFIISAAIASGSVLISYQLKNKYKKDFFGTLMYMQVFLFTFGFYAIWGQVLIKSLLSKYVTPDLMGRISHILTYLGTPFLVFGWYMLIRFSVEFTAKKSIPKLLLWFFTVNIMVLFFVGYMIYTDAEVGSLIIIKYYYIILNLLYTTIAALILIIQSKKSIDTASSNRMFGVLFLSVTLLECLLIYYYRETNIYLALVFIFVYFFGSGFVSVYIRYFSIQTEEIPDASKQITLDEFCKLYDITNREREIILEIYSGLTNQQIANKLFISLQTVKDHTSRIYSKTNTQSRVQLIKILQESFAQKTNT